MPDDDSGQARPWYACAHPISIAIRQTMIYLPTHSLSYSFSVPFSLERLHIAKDINYLTYPDLPLHPSQSTPFVFPILHRPHTVIHQPGLPTSISHLQRQPPSPPPSLPKVAQAHPPETGPPLHSPLTCERSPQPRPPPSAAISLLSTIGHPFPITTPPPPLPGSATTVLIYPSKTRPPPSPVTTLSPFPHFSYSFSLPLFFFLPPSFFIRAKRNSLLALEIL